MQYTSMNKFRTSCSANGKTGKGTKYAISENWYTITQMVTYPWTGGKSVVKSIDFYSGFSGNTQGIQAQVVGGFKRVLESIYPTVLLCQVQGESRGEES